MTATVDMLKRDPLLVEPAFVAAIPHADVPLPFKDGAWMLHMAAALIFMVGAIDSLFLFISARRKL
ncbi:hypothetical protein [Ralstonia pseudosolanacearum]|uniref:hypothetical protein n=1 Tax=Ralstonia pseudosolanacearum TaxID=1310165 RepID=UPI003221FA33